MWNGSSVEMADNRELCDKCKRSSTNLRIDIDGDLACETCWKDGNLDDSDELELLEKGFDLEDNDML